MKGYFFSLLFLALSLLPSGLVASSPSIRIFVDQDQLSLQGTLTLSILIQGGSALTSPELPPLKNFEILGRSQSNSIEIVNGQMSVTKTFEYHLRPQKTGRLQLGPISTFIEGQEFKAGPLYVQVKEDSHLPQVSRPPSFSPSPFPPPPPSPWPAPKPAPSAQQAETFIKASFNKKSAYLGEEVLFTLRLYSSESLREFSYTPPKLGDFIREELVKERQYETYLKGKRYLVVEWKSALYPLKVGSLESGQIKIKAKVPLKGGRQDPFANPFFNSFPSRRHWQQQEWVSENLKLEVKALPAAPKNFTGLVGDFSLEAHLQDTKLKLGENTELLLRIQGKGNLAAGKIPNWELPGFKIYPATPQVKIQDKNKGLSGTKDFQYSLVALKAGDFALSLPDFSYFDPQLGKYQNFKNFTWALQVESKPQKEDLLQVGLSTPKKTSILDKVVFKQLQGGVLANASWFRPSHYLAWTFLALMPLLYALLVLVSVWRKRSSLQEQDRRRSQAFSRMKSQLKNLKPGQEESLSLIIKNYFSDRLKIKASAMTAKELGLLLSEQGLSPEVVAALSQELEQLEYAQYAPASEQEDWQQRLQRLLPLMRQIEKRL